MSKEIWERADFSLPRPAGISLEDVTFEVMSLFGRRRDLIYQLAILSLIGSAIHWSFRSSPASFFQRDARFWTSIFLAAASSLFFLRFAVINGALRAQFLLFKLLEAKVFFSLSNEDNDFADYCRRNLNESWRWFSVTFLAYLFFGALSFESIAVAVYFFDRSPAVPFWLVILTAALPVVLLGLAAYLMNNAVLHEFRSRKDTLVSDDKNLIADERSLRTYYHQAMAETHSHMTSIIALSIIPSFTTISLAFSEAGTANAVDSILINRRLGVSDPFFRFFVITAFLMSFVAYLMYLRNASSLLIYKSKLSMPETDLSYLLGQRLDCLVGFVVISAYVALSAGMLIFGFHSLVWPRESGLDSEVFKWTIASFFLFLFLPFFTVWLRQFKSSQ